jgi:hypothetical protein
VTTIQRFAPRFFAATLVVSLIMIISGASLAAIAVLWTEPAPFARKPSDGMNSRDVTGSRFQQEPQVVERPAASAGKWM